MATRVLATERPEQVLDAAGGLLAGDPIRHNVILTLLNARVAAPGPGRYWIVSTDEEPAGVVFQSPLDFIATITVMSAEAAAAAVERMARDGVRLPGVSGEAAAAAHFAGLWAEQTGAAVYPTQAQRIYEAKALLPARATPGAIRRATASDRDLLVAWVGAFSKETGEAGAGGEPGSYVDRRLLAEELWVWEHHQQVAMAGVSKEAAGVVRIGPVYTPPSQRRRGFASALVAAITSTARSNGLRCVLYTDLANPTSNSIYRAVGYRAVAEVLRYRFEHAS